MKILIIGGRGFIGSAISKRLREDGHDVIISTRRSSDSKEVITWRPPDLLPPEVISTIDAVINLSGEPIAPGRWTPEKKKKIMESRVETTRALVKSLGQSEKRPSLLINASAVGYYGPCGDEVITEDSPPGSDFLASVCVKWEEVAKDAETLGLRVVILRFGTVLDRDGGALPRMMKPFKMFLGGWLGSGRQWFPWIHREDIAGMVSFIIDNESLFGVFNATAPQAVTNLEFSKTLARVLHRPCIFPVPGFVLRLALGEFGNVLLTGQKAIPQRILKAGYKFKYPRLESALRAIINPPA